MQTACCSKVLQTTIMTKRSTNIFSLFLVSGTTCPYGNDDGGGRQRKAVLAPITTQTARLSTSTPRWWQSRCGQRRTTNGNGWTRPRWRRKLFNRARRRLILMKLEQGVPRSKRIEEGAREILAWRKIHHRKKDTAVEHVPADRHVHLSTAAPTDSLRREPCHQSKGGRMNFKTSQPSRSRCACPLTPLQAQRRGFSRGESPLDVAVVTLLHSTTLFVTMETWNAIFTVLGLSTSRVLPLFNSVDVLRSRSNECNIIA